MPNANLSFLPWVRQGAAAAITVADTLGSKQNAVAELSAALTLNDAPVPGIAVRLRGPADVIGIDANQVVRTDPRAGTSTFEPNCFVSIEFDRPDFPWLFTPARANANAQLRPWLCLVVVQKQVGVTLAGSVEAPLPALQIAAPAKPATELPNLTDSWAWAHAQVAADDSSPPAIGSALNGAPELSLSRLLCPRMLAADTEYIACVVPAFDLGRKAGLGLPIADADLTAAGALAPAWSLTPAAPAQVRLPVYYHWEFRTGQGGDFESLARRLTTANADGLGKRPIDISQPGFPASGATTLDMEGALLPIRSPAGTPPPWGAPPLTFQTTLAAIVNEPSRSQASDPNADPLLAPPLYGRWHAGKAAATPDGTTWLDQLNLDPRWRAGAALGTRVVQEQQEALMASAWVQAADLPAANQRLRQFQLSLAVGESLHRRHFQPLSEEAVLRVAAPAFGRLRPATGAALTAADAKLSLLAKQAGSELPIAANRSAMRRIGRLRGPLTRRVAAQGFERSTSVTWVARLNDDMGNPPAQVLPPPPAPDFAALPNLPIEHLDTDSFFGTFFVAPENGAVAWPGGPVLVPNKTEVPGFFRAAAREHIKGYFVPRPIPITPHFVIFQNIKPLVLEQTQPRMALPALINAVISTGDWVLAPTATGVQPTGAETVMAAPTFPQPMYEQLRDLAQDLLLPGLDKIAPETVLGLQTNQRFVEAYLVGLNHELGRELLWRGYPTDQRGTYFSHFWGLGVPNAAPADITDLNTWQQRSLGDPIGAPAGAEFVLAVRSSLLQRYPNAVIFLTPVLLPAGAATRAPDEDPAHEKPPIFTGSMQPDVSFFGFPVTTEAATGTDGGPGYYVVIQQHPTEPRFGLDSGISLGGASHLSIGTGPPPGVPLNGRTWGKNAAEMAGIVRRLPVRIAIAASRLLTPA